MAPARSLAAIARLNRNSSGDGSDVRWRWPVSIRTPAILNRATLLTDPGSMQLEGQFTKSFPTGGTPGSNFVVYEEDGTSINYPDSAGNKVTLSLSGHGTMDVIRAASGQGELLTLLNTVPGMSTLTGTVTQGGTGNGTTTLTAIYGLTGFTNNLPNSFVITG